MTGELRAQRREPCNRQRLHDFDGWRVVPCRTAGERAACPGCNGDGTRWVTVGELRQPSVVDEDGCWVPTWDDRRSNPSCLRHLGREVGRALYVIEETS